MQKRLDELTVKNLKPESKTYYCTDTTDVTKKGFGVRVYPSGAKVFIFRYKVDGVQKLLTLGEYPSISLKDARDEYLRAALKVKDLRRGSKDGADPVHERKKGKELRIIAEHENKKAPTVKELVQDYVNLYAKVKKRNWKEDERILNKDVVSRWGKLKAATILRKDIIGMVDEISLTSPSSAALTLKITRKMFNWALDKERIPMTPCLGVTAEPDKERTRALSETEIVTVWNKLDSLPMSGEMRNALKLVLFTAQRRGEVTGIHTREIDGHWWTIPAERAKNKREHRVYLTATALGIVAEAIAEAKASKEKAEARAAKKEKREAWPAEQEYSGYIFPCPHRTKDKAIEGHALSVAVRRCLEWPLKDKKGKPLFGADGKPATENLIGTDQWTLHDLRRTATTLMSKCKIGFEHRERVLNHTMGKLDRIYNQHDFDDEKQIALETLERKLNSIIIGSENKVIPISAGKKAA